MLVLRFALWAINRNVQRAMWISRRDNNYLFNVKWELKYILDRMKNNYK